LVGGPSVTKVFNGFSDDVCNCFEAGGSANAGGKMPSEKTNEHTRREWRELGFYYDRDDDQKAWRIVGALDGLQKFSRAVRTYATNLKNAAPSKHDHFGPYMYLTIGTWPEEVITDGWIAGPLERLAKLADDIDEVIATARVGDQIPVGAKFAPNSSYDLILELRDDSFDPAKADKACW
jgi:hypothetical protein